ncbi:MAG: NAD(P)H-hydrate dehydratase [Deltaproteobacteria bacterium]|nr:NAD(P)H-hydrate dehydratase [Deltaproteobacteria bacterium]
MRLATASEIREMDNLTINEAGISGIVLMENAARNATKVFLDHFNPQHGSSVVILCGKGNNGGDGYVMARYLHEKGMDVSVMITGEKSAISGDALVNLKIIEKLGLKISEIPDDEALKGVNESLVKCGYIIDGLLGTGLNSPVRGFFKKIIENVNQSGKPVMSIDIPSGLNADTGNKMGAAIKADLTVTFGLPKPGQLVYPGAELVGRLVNIDIGIPGMISGRIKPSHWLIEPEDFIRDLARNRRDIHKGTRGHLLILAGSTGKTGAATLAAMGALRVGAGLVTVGVPKSLNPVLECKLTEAMTAPLAETDEGSLCLKAENDIDRLLSGKTALAIGPGLSTNPETVKLVWKIIKKCELPMVIDADALNALSMTGDSLGLLDEKKILTPHPGEMGRLMGLEAREVQAERLKIAHEFAKRWNCNLVLKGARTIVADPKGVIHINPTGNPALSTGGTGDVLTGIISGLLAGGLSEIKAATAGVYIHGLAADYFAEQNGETGLIATDLLDIIPFLMDSVIKGINPLENPDLLSGL